MKFLKNIFKRENKAPKFKRQSNDERTWMPLASYGRGSATGLYSTYVSRALQVISDLLIVCPLKAEKPGELFKLISKMPCSIMSRGNWLKFLVEHYFLYQGFYCLIYTDNNGSIKSLIPFTPYSLQVYPVTKKTFGDRNIDDSGNYADGLAITERGYYYKDHLGRNWPLDKIFALYSSMYKTDSLIDSNDFGRQINFEALSSANYFEHVINQLVVRHGKPELLISGLGGEDLQTSSPETDAVVKELKAYFSEDNKRDALALPPGYQLKSLFDQHHPGPIFQVLSDVICTQIANMFSLPKSLLNAVGDQAMVKHDRETYLSGSFLSLTRQISDQLNYISGYNENISFDIDGLKLKMQTSRDEHNMLQTLVDSGLYTKEEILNKVNLT